MKFPHKVRITSKVSYEVVWVDRFDNEAWLGECRPDNKQIVLRRGRPERETLQTFIHEILHAVEFEYGAAIPHRLVYQLEEAFEAILRLNRWC